MALSTTPAAGAKLRASVLSSLITERTPISARKTADETGPQNNTLQNDDVLFVSVTANYVYRFVCNIHYNSGTTPDFKYGWTFPTGLTMRYTGHHYGLTAVAESLYFIQTDVPTLSGNAGNISASLHGIIIVGSSSGTLQLQWAQNTTTASNTTVLAGSHLTLWRME